MSVQFVSVTDVGVVRGHNEDAVGDPEICRSLVASNGIAQHGFLFAVADGMGGHEGGEVASAMAVDTLFRSYYSAHGDAGDALLGGFGAAGAAVFAAATERLARRITEHGATAGPAQLMGTTLVAAAVVDHRAVVANVGDSRAYLLHAGTLKRITTDHSLVGEHIRAGVLTESEAAHVNYRNILLRALGQSAEEPADGFEVTIANDDVLLLCSDGLHGVVSEKEIRDILMTNPIDDAARQLVRRANELGGPDNISVVIVRVADQELAGR